VRLFTLLRIANPEQGIFGVLKDGDMPFCVTVENNAFVIPDGDYICRRVNSPKFGNTFEITNVPGRSNVLFHGGNWEEDSTGCIVLGEKFEPIWDEKRKRLKEGVMESNKAFSEFKERTVGLITFSLKVRTVG